MPRIASRAVAIVAGVMVVVSLGGLLTLGLLSAFVWDKYNAYGEIPIRLIFRERT